MKQTATFPIYTGKANPELRGAHVVPASSPCGKRVRRGFCSSALVRRHPSGHVWCDSCGRNRTQDWSADATTSA